MSSKKAPAILIAALFVVSSTVGAESKPTMKSLGDGLICQCGCNQTVNACNHLECSTRSEMTALAQKEIAAGKEETTIFQDFVLHYGVQVLASPPAKGFNLTVWLLPGIGLLAGLALVIAIVRHWRKPAVAEGPPHAPVDPKLLAAVEEEMKKVTSP